MKMNNEILDHFDANGVSRTPKRGGLDKVIDSLPSSVEISWSFNGQTGTCIYPVHKGAMEINDSENYYLPLPKNLVKAIAQWGRDNEYVPE